jgi:hypothetical protein
MQPKPNDDASIRGDRLDLDFGKNKFRIREKEADSDAVETTPKLPPEPGRVAPATTVPWAEVLNPPKK